MAPTSGQIERALGLIDGANACDPVSELGDGGDQEPRALLYGRRMSRWLDRLEPNPTPALLLATRAQHLCRWRLPRNEYPMDRAGYKAWRVAAAEMHADLASEILAEVGCQQGFIDRVRFILRKKKLKVDPQVQTLEDVACLVFLEHHLARFVSQTMAAVTDDTAARKAAEAKLVRIVRKTWLKMSERGHQAALTIDLPEREKQLVALALAGSD